MAKTLKTEDLERWVGLHKALKDAEQELAYLRVRISAPIPGDQVEKFKRLLKAELDAKKALDDFHAEFLQSL